MKILLLLVLIFSSGVCHKSGMAWRSGTVSPGGHHRGQDRKSA